MLDCLVDGRPSDSYLCFTCREQLAGELREVPWLVEQLTITLTRQARTGAEQVPRRSADIPLPYDQSASVDLETLASALYLWAVALGEAREIRLPATRDPAAVASWLERWVDQAAQLPTAAEFHSDVVAMMRAGRRTVDLSAGRRFVGPCDGFAATVEPEEPGGCGADLYTSLKARTAVCRTEGCGARYEVERRRVWLLEQAVDQFRTARQLSVELPWIAGITINAKTISMWALRGKLTKYGPHRDDPTKSTRYRVGEIVEVARAMAAQKATLTVDDTLSHPA